MTTTHDDRRRGRLPWGSALAVIGVGLLALAGGASGPRSESGVPYGPSLEPGPTWVEAATPSDAADPSREVAQCGPSLQSRVDASAPGSILDLTGCAYRGGARIDHSLHLIGATVEVPVGETAIVVEADDVTIERARIIGRQSIEYRFDEIGILALGTAEEPISGLSIIGSEIRSFGGFGTYLRHVTGVQVTGNRVEDIVYAGVMVLSGGGGRIAGNIVRRVGVAGSEANGGNAYGIALTTGGGDTEPTVDVTVIGNTITDVPTWQALDTHGGRRIVFRDNIVRASMRGVFITMDGAGNQPSDIVVVGNQLLDPPPPLGDRVQAVTTYRANNVVVTRNSVTGWGEGNFFGDFEAASRGLVVVDNDVTP